MHDNVDGFSPMDNLFMATNKRPSMAGKPHPGIDRLSTDIKTLSARVETLSSTVNNMASAIESLPMKVASMSLAVDSLNAKIKQVANY